MSKLRILSVDDEGSFTELLEQYFSPRDYAIDVASDGAEGLRLLKSKEYDVVLLDLRMVGINGDEVMRQIKSYNDNIKIIFVTAYADAGRTKERLIKEGAYAYVEKPLSSLKDLEALVNEAVGNELNNSKIT
ncbi:MAG: response regulator [Candidatus Omnitrophota bacterium]